MASLSRQELIELVVRVTNPQPGDSDADLQEIMRTIEDSVPDPNVSAYIFWDNTGMTPEQVIDKALSYRPFAL